MNASMMPTIFIAHGSPMLALDLDAGAWYQAWGQALPKPDAVVVFSAHWESPSLALGETATRHQLIYDFGGFPTALYDIQYPAPGAAWLTDDIKACLDDDIALNSMDRGLDHGVWVPLLHVFPQADVPVLQISMPSGFDDKGLFELGRRLRPLREKSVLLAGTGNLTHNLYQVNPDHHGAPLTWASAFDRWIEDTLVNGDTEALLDWRHRAPYAEQNHPTPEHLRPLFIVAGAAAESIENVSFPIQGFEWGSLSRRCVQFG